MIRRTQQSQRRHGVAAVEMAMLLVPLMFILVGTWETTRMVEVLQVLQNACREGARVAAAGQTFDIFGNTIPTNQPQLTVVSYIQAAGFDTTNVAGSASTYFPTFSNLTTPSNTNYQAAAQMDKLQVSITFPLANSRFVFLPNVMVGGATLSASAVWYSQLDIPVAVDTNLIQN